MWKQLYDSPWHNPATFIVVNAALLVTLLRARSPLRAFLLVFTAEILLDATLTNDRSPIPSSLVSYVAIPFVILGDARVWILLERARRAKRAEAFARSEVARATLVGLSLAFIVPVLQALLLRAAPTFFAPSRRMFLAYECLFLLAMALYSALILRPSLASAEPAMARWAQAIARFALVQYALWASADVIILAGHDAGFALRLAANVLYYAAFLPFAWRSAPEALR